MPALVDTMAYKYDAVPWHGLGVAVEGDVTVEGMLEKAGLTWGVQRRKVYMHSSKDQPEVVEIPEYYAVTRETGEVFQVAGSQYRPLQNKDVLAFFKQYCEAGDMQLETAGSLKGGAVIWALAQIEKARFDLGDDAHRGYMLLANSHDGSMSFQGQLTDVRVVCWNTLSAALSDGAARFFSLRHTKQFTNGAVQRVKHQVERALEVMKAHKARLETLATAPVKDGMHLLEFAARLVQPSLLLPAPGTTPTLSEGKPVGTLAVGWRDLHKPAREVVQAVRYSPGSGTMAAKGTWYGALQGYTHYADHVAGDDQEARLYSAWFGARAGQKEQAVELAEQFAQL